MTRLLTLWRKSLSVQLLASTLIALTMSQGIGMWISWDKFIADLLAAARYELSSCAEAVAQLVETVPPALQSDIARINSTDYTRLWIADDPTPDLEPWTGSAFAPFFRLKGSRSHETGGIGLGLSIARAIARPPGGDIVLPA